MSVVVPCVCFAPPWPCPGSRPQVVTGTSVSTRLITFATQNQSIMGIQIVTQPGTGPGPALLGNFLAVQPQVRVVDSWGEPVPNASVIAIFVNDDCSAAPAIMDVR